MLVLKRSSGQWTACTCKCGRAFRFRVYRVHDGAADVAFDDPPRDFEFQREERMSHSILPIPARDDGPSAA